MRSWEFQNSLVLGNIISSSRFKRHTTGGCCVMRFVPSPSTFLESLITMMQAMNLNKITWWAWDDSLSVYHPEQNSCRNLSCFAFDLLKFIKSHSFLVKMSPETPLPGASRHILVLFFSRTKFIFVHLCFIYVLCVSRSRGDRESLRNN